MCWYFMISPCWPVYVIIVNPSSPFLAPAYFLHTWNWCFYSCSCINPAPLSASPYWWNGCSLAASGPSAGTGCGFLFLRWLLAFFRTCSILAARLLALLLLFNSVFSVEAAMFSSLDFIDLNVHWSTSDDYFPCVMIDSREQVFS